MSDGTRSSSHVCLLWPSYTHVWRDLILFTHQALWNLNHTYTVCLLRRYLLISMSGGTMSTSYWRIVWLCFKNISAAWWSERQIILRLPRCVLRPHDTREAVTWNVLVEVLPSELWLDAEAGGGEGRGGGRRTLRESVVYIISMTPFPLVPDDH